MLDTHTHTHTHKLLKSSVVHKVTKSVSCGHRTQREALGMPEERLIER